MNLLDPLEHREASFVLIVAAFALAWWFTEWPRPPAVQALRAAWL